jgi:hypothetical protein
MQVHQLLLLGEDQPNLVFMTSILHQLKAQLNSRGVVRQLVNDVHLLFGGHASFLEQLCDERVADSRELRVAYSCR